MADENVGTISYTLDAKTEALVEANRKAEKSIDSVSNKFDKGGAASKKFDARLKTLSSSVKKTTDTLKKTTVTATAVVAALTAIAKTSASAGLEIKSMAALSNTSVERFQELAYGASQVGVSAEKLGDIFKDVQDKMGDFINTGGGELKDYFENIAPLVGQTADEFRDLSGADALIKFKEGLDAANISASEQIFYLESLANDVAMLNPLLKNGAQGFKDAAKEARDLNLVLSEAEVQELADVNKEFNKLLSTIAKVTQKVVAENGPQIRKAIQQMSDLFISVAGYADKFFKTMGGGSAISKLETQSAELVGRLEQLESFTKKDFAIESKTDTTQKLIDTFLAVEKLQKEYEKLQNDSQLNLDVKADRMDSVMERISILNGELVLLREDLTEEYRVYVETETQKAQEELMLVNGQIASLQEASKKPITIEIKSGKDKPLSVDKNNIPSIFDTEEGKLDGGGDDSVSVMNAGLQDGLGITQQMAAQVESLDAKFQNLGTTINDTLVGSALTFGDTIGNAFASGIAEGESFRDIMSSIGTTISTQVLSSLISLGVQYGINAVLQSSADATMAASSVAATATTTAAGVASAAALNAAYTPAAIAASIATSGGAAAAGTAGLTTAYATGNALSLSGGRLNGGPVSAGNAYEVTEDGKPEMLTVGGKNILMMGNQSGTVTSNKDLSSDSGSGGVIVNIQNNASGSEATATSTQQDNKTIIDVVVSNINSRGKIHKTITDTTTANNKV